ncbi:MAG: discoidin domain-containing protein [Deltaproteobacteria bacterium]|nr:discoidin domain-containing protein [Deltaproteobacteria bacterium]
MLDLSPDSILTGAVQQIFPAFVLALVAAALHVTTGIPSRLHVGKAAGALVAAVLGALCWWPVNVAWTHLRSASAPSANIRSGNADSRSETPPPAAPGRSVRVKRPEFDVSCSSEQTRTSHTQRRSHPCEFAVDGDPTTAWQEDVDGCGDGSWIQLRFRQPIAIDRISFTTGFDKTDWQLGDLFAKNCHVAAYHLEIDGNVQQTKPVGPSERRAEGVVGKVAAQLRIVVDRTYPGTFPKEVDLAITELSVWKLEP